MCLESSKQSFSMYTALQLAGDRGSSYADLVQSMEKISRDVFDSSMYVYSPLPLKSLLKQAMDSQEVRLIQGNRIKLTEKGDKILRYLRQYEIAGCDQANLAAVASTECEVA